MRMSNFQLIFTGVFIAFILAGVVAFSLYSSKGNSIGAVQIWGTADGGTMQQVLAQLNTADRSFQDVTYVQKDPSTYVSDVIDAMASGSGPDIILISQDQLLSFQDKVDTIPYSAVPQSVFSSFVGEGQMFLTSQGSLALPLFINPLVMYWNRDLFNSAGYGQPPQYWNELLSEAGKITKLDASKNITQSAVALGGWDNIRYAKAILATLVMQAGDPIVDKDQTGGYQATLGEMPQNATENPATSALQFYTEFANPSKTSYSWNRSLPDSQDAFVGGTLAVYLGFASDYAGIAARNPNLHFGVAVLPQIQGNSTHLTFGELTGMAIPRTARNPQGALQIAEKLAGKTGAPMVAQAFGLPSVRTDASQDTSGNAAAQAFFQSALISRGWYDPDINETSDIFKTMVDDVVSNKSQPDSAVAGASQSLQAIMPKNTVQ